MSETFEIELSPFAPNLGTALGLTFMVLPPYSDKGLTLRVNPNVVNYQTDGAPNEGIVTAQLMETSDSGPILTAGLALGGNDTASFLHGGKQYQVKLLRADKKQREGQQFQTYEFLIEEAPAAPIHKEGSLTFWLRHPNADWTTDSARYDFEPISKAGVTVRAAKTPKKHIYISIAGPLAHNFEFERPIPKTDARGLFVAITWKGDSITLYLNGQPDETQTVDQAIERRA